MITQVEVKGVLNSRIPSMRIETIKGISIHKMVIEFANYTKEQVKTGNIPLVGECFDTADFLLKEGNYHVKNAIENIYVYSVGIFLGITGAISKQVKEILPASLKDEFRNQVKNSLP